MKSIQKGNFSATVSCKSILHLWPAKVKWNLSKSVQSWGDSRPLTRPGQSEEARCEEPPQRHRVNLSELCIPIILFAAKLRTWSHDVTWRSHDGRSLALLHLLKFRWAAPRCPRHAKIVNIGDQWDLQSIPTIHPRSATEEVVASAGLSPASHSSSPCPSLAVRLDSRHVAVIARLRLRPFTLSKQSPTLITRNTVSPTKLSWRSCSFLMVKTNAGPSPVEPQKYQWPCWLVGLCLHHNTCSWRGLASVAVLCSSMVYLQSKLRSSCWRTNTSCFHFRIQ